MRSIATRLGSVVMGALCLAGASPAAAHDPAAYTGTIQIVHTGTLGVLPNTLPGASASGSLRYEGDYQLSGRRGKRPSNSSVSPSKGAWYYLTGTGTNKLDLNLQWSEQEPNGSSSQSVTRKWSGGGPLTLTSNPRNAGQTRPVRLLVKNGRFYLELWNLGDIAAPYVPGFPVDIFAERYDVQSCDPDPGSSRRHTTYKNGLIVDELQAGCPHDPPVDPPYPRQVGATHQLTLWPLNVWDPSISGGESPPPLCRPPRHVRVTTSEDVACGSSRSAHRFNGHVATGAYLSPQTDCPFIPWAPGGGELGPGSYAETCQDPTTLYLPHWGGADIYVKRQTVVTYKLKPSG